MTEVTSVRRCIYQLPVFRFGGADRNLDTLTSKNDYAKRSFIF